MSFFNVLKSLVGLSPNPTVRQSLAVPHLGDDGLVFQFEQGWKVGHEHEIPGQYSILELIHEEDDIEDWKELFTIENIGVATGFPFGHYHFAIDAGLPRIGSFRSSSDRYGSARATFRGLSPQLFSMAPIDDSIDH